MSQTPPGLYSTSPETIAVLGGKLLRDREGKESGRYGCALALRLITVIILCTGLILSRFAFNRVRISMQFIDYQSVLNGQEQMITVFSLIDPRFVVFAVDMK